MVWITVHASYTRSSVMLKWRWQWRGIKLLNRAATQHRKQFLAATIIGSLLALSSISLAPAQAKTAEEYLKQARELGESDDLLVVKLATRAIQVNPRSAEAYDVRATAQMRRKRLKEAVEDATRAIRINPKQAHAYAIRAKAGYLMGDASNEDVIRDVQTAVRLDPKVDDGYYLLAVALTAMKKHKEACDAFDKAKVLNPKDKMTWRFSSTAHALIGDVQGALKDLTMYIKLSPRDPDGYISRAGYYQELKMPDKALADYEQAIKLEPHQYPFRMRRAAYLVKIGKHKEAVDDYTAAIKLNDVDEDLYLRRGNEYVILKQYDKALADFTEAIELSSNYEVAYRARARLYTVLGKGELAAKDRAKADELRRRPAEQKI